MVSVYVGLTWVRVEVFPWGRVGGGRVVAGRRRVAGDGAQVGLDVTLVKLERQRVGDGLAALLGRRGRLVGTPPQDALHYWLHLRKF